MLLTRFAGIAPIVAPADGAQPLRLHLVSAILGDLMGATVRDRFELRVDDQARQWLEEHPQASRLFIAYMSSRACCSGARVCDVRIRVDTAASQPDARGASWVALGLLSGREVLIDARLIDRMPAQLRFIQRGVGPFRHLDLDLSGEQWADVLYPVPR
jgi:hypothetical protein